MKLKYLKNAPLGKVGDIADVPNEQARVLIRLGYAKEYKPRKTKPKSDDGTGNADDMDDKAPF